MLGTGKSKIKYAVDSQEDRVVVYAYATDLENDGVDIYSKMCRKAGIILTDYAFENLSYDFYLPNKLMAKATWMRGSIDTYSYEKGCEIARRRLYDKYNHIMKSVIGSFLLATYDIKCFLTDYSSIINARFENYKKYEKEINSTNN